MKHRFESISDYINGRDLAVWGIGSGANDVIACLNSLGIEIKYFISKDYKSIKVFNGKPVYSKLILNKNNVYVVDATSFYNEISTELEILGFKNAFDFYNWYDDIVPFDYVYNGVSIGKCSYFPRSFFSFMSDQQYNGFKWSHIESIGRFVSINSTAQIHFDHEMMALSTGIFSRILGEREDDYLRILEENKRKNTKLIEKTVIGNDVWIGANAFINLSKVKSIGDGAIIGAGAVVIEDVPPFSIVAGVPARVKKHRYTPNQIKILQQVQWWNWSNEKIKNNMELFANPSCFFEKYS